MTRMRAHQIAAIGLIFGVPSALAGCGLETGRILSPEGCTNKTTVDAELHVDSTDARWIWGIDRRTGAAVSLRIPGGYGVAQDPPVIVDPAGREMGRTGDSIVSGCRDIIQNAILIDQSDIRPPTTTSQ
jgi:hypothetical protein